MDDEGTTACTQDQGQIKNAEGSEITEAREESRADPVDNGAV
jgi:hypothetical protein